MAMKRWASLSSESLGPAANGGSLPGILPKPPETGPPAKAMISVADDLTLCAGCPSSKSRHEKGGAGLPRAPHIFASSHASRTPDDLVERLAGFGPQFLRSSASLNRCGTST